MRSWYSKNTDKVRLGRGRGPGRSSSRVFGAFQGVAERRLVVGEKEHESSRGEYDYAPETGIWDGHRVRGEELEAVHVKPGRRRNGRGKRGMDRRQKRCFKIAPLVGGTTGRGGLRK